MTWRKLAFKALHVLAFSIQYKTQINCRHCCFNNVIFSTFDQWSEDANVMFNPNTNFHSQENCSGA